MILKIKTNILNKISAALEKESSNSNLVGVIAIFMIAVSFIGNTNSVNSMMLKGSIGESVSYKNNTKITNITEDLTIGRQTIRINGVEYVVDITPKY